MTRRWMRIVALAIAAAGGASVARAQFVGAPELINRPARLEKAAPIPGPPAFAAAPAKAEGRAAASEPVEPPASKPIAPPASHLFAPPASNLVESPAGATPLAPPPIEQPDGAAAIVDGWLSPDRWASPEQLGSSVQMLLLLSVLSLAPALLVMTTSFVRTVVVLGLLRQAIGTQQLPPNQVMTALALFLTLAVMSPTWKQVYEEAISPYSDHQIDLETAWQRGVAPVRRFMSLQIERTGNSDDVFLFLDHMPHVATPTNYDEVPLEALVPAFMLSELKTAFLIGFQIYLPFVILDLVISSVLMSMGMLMLPPVLVSLPFKLLLFVLVDGWHLVVGMLLESFAGVV
ncbi:MAG: flagellar type III secretion system pore protein FliP [Pirellulales bacterium]